MNNELTFQGLMLILKRRRAIIGWTISACLFLGVIASIYFFIKPSYRAQGEIEVRKSATDGLGLENLTNPTPEQPDALEDSINLQTQATILQSNSLALKVIEDLGLENTEDFRPVFSPIGWTLGLLTPSGMKDPPNATLQNAPRRRERATKVFQKHLKIKPQSGTRLIDIQYTSSDPKTAAAVVNDVAKSLVDYTLNSRYTATSQVSGWLAGQLGDIKKEAEMRQGKVEALQRASGVYALGITDAQGKEIAYSATLDQLQQDTQNLSAATSNRIIKGALYKSVENGDPELISGLAGSSLAGASQAVNNSFLLLQNLRTQQATLASQVASDSSRYGTANPKLGDEKASLDSINAQIKAEINRIGGRAANDYKASQSVENKLREVYVKQRKAADNLNDKTIALMIARQEAADARKLYQTLNSHLKEAGVIEGLRSSNISVVDPGQIPAKPLPYVLVCLVLSLITGLILGASRALFAEATDDKIGGIVSIENLLRVPVMAVLPLTQERSRSFRELGLRARPRLGGGDEGTEGSRIAVLDGPNTAYVEALRGLRTSLLHPRKGPPPKTILVTSAAEQEGKSTLSLNLAAALVLNGSRVLLVDGDLRSAGLSGYLGFERQTSGILPDDTHGLSEALSSVNSPNVLTPFPEYPGLYALPAGSAPRYPAELLGRERLRKLVDSWSSHYDYVIIDSPPVLAVTDALIVARYVDTTLLVTRHGVSTQKSLERAYHSLLDTESSKVSVVVNGVHRDSVSFSEFYGYSGTAYYSEA